eukprot:4221902-Prymnesium_polylepis.1
MVAAPTAVCVVAPYVQAEPRLLGRATGDATRGREARAARARAHLYAACRILTRRRARGPSRAGALARSPHTLYPFLRLCHAAGHETHTAGARARMHGRVSDGTRGAEERGCAMGA